MDVCNGKSLNHILLGILETIDLKFEAKFVGKLFQWSDQRFKIWWRRSGVKKKKNDILISACFSLASSPLPRYYIVFFFTRCLVSSMVVHKPVVHGDAYRWLVFATIRGWQAKVEGLQSFGWYTTEHPFWTCSAGCTHGVGDRWKFYPIDHSWSGWNGWLIRLIDDDYFTGNTKVPLDLLII